MNGRTDGWTDGQTDGRMDGRTDGRTNGRAVRLYYAPNYIWGHKNTHKTYHILVSATVHKGNDGYNGAGVWVVPNVMAFMEYVSVPKTWK